MQLLNMDSRHQSTRPCLMQQHGEACAYDHCSVRDAGVDEARMEALKPVNKRAKTEPKQCAPF